VSKNATCYLCGAKKLRVLRSKLRHNIERNVLECRNCSLVYLEPAHQDLKGFYEEEYRKLYTPVIGNALNSQELFDICLPIQKDRVERLKYLLDPTKKILDVGCASGAFLYSVKSYVNECRGMEFNSDNVRFVKEVLGIKVYNESIEKADLPKDYFDIVTIFQVLEHVDDPLAFLKEIYNLLKPEGVICVEVPNIHDALLSVYEIEQYADFWFREPHIFNYSPQTLTLMLEKAGFNGETETIQSYNFINHINWMLKGEPQLSMDIGIAKPILVSSNSAIADELNLWIEKINREYKTILTKYGVGENVFFVGKKK